jgi:FeS assembly SUF system regulator
MREQQAMLKLSKITDYGVVVLSNLSKGGNDLLSAVDIAASTGIPEPTVAKVLKTAARADLVIGQRGAGGGYRLARPAVDITITDIVEAFEGPIALTACVDGGDGNCSVEAFCTMRHNWDVVNKAIRTALTTVTLKDMSTGHFNKMSDFMDFDPKQKTNHIPQPEPATAE